VNPAAFITTYCSLVDGKDPQCTAEINPILKPIIDCIVANNWWVRTVDAQSFTFVDQMAATSPKPTITLNVPPGGQVSQQWGYHCFDVLPPAGAVDTGSGNPAFLGKTFARIFAEFVLAQVAPPAARMSVWIDNLYETTRVVADFLRTGTNQRVGDAAASAAMRSVFVEFVGWLRTLSPGVLVGGNVFGNCSSAEFKGLLDFAFCEGQMGKPYSLEYFNGWAGMQARYTDLLGNVRAGGAVAFQVYGAAADYALMRYGIASALQAEGGYFVYTPASAWTEASRFDEQNVPLGRRVGGGVAGPLQWSDYEGGRVLVNTSGRGNGSVVGTSGSLDCAGFRRLAGTQDLLINNGRPCGVETLAPRTGLVLVRSA
jgi:hypothetical protein